MMLLPCFLLVLASAKAISGSSCLVETLKCSRLRPTLPTYRGLFVSSLKMDEMCRQQDLFFKCLDNVAASRSNRQASLPSALQLNRILIKDLCSTDSSLRKKYFELAQCINEQDMDYCPPLELLGHYDGGSLIGSPLHEKSVNCIAVILSFNCGMDAGRLFLHLLRMANDGDASCSMAASELTLCDVQESQGERELHNEEFVKLMYSVDNTRRHETVDYPLPVETILEDKDGEIYWDSVLASVDSQSSNPTFEMASKTFDDDIASRLGLIDMISPEKLKEYKKPLEIKEPESALRYHDKNSLSQYVRLSLHTFRELVFCENVYEDGKKMHVCTQALRENNPICLEGGRTRNLTGINPEDIDPEMGARLYAMFPYAYYFRPYEEMSERMFKHVHEVNKNSFDRIREFRNALPQATDDSNRAKDSITENINVAHVQSENGSVKDSHVNRPSEASYPDSENVEDKIDGTKKRAVDLGSYMMAINASRDGRKEKSMDGFLKSRTPSNDDSNFKTHNLSEWQETLFNLLLDETNWIMDKVYKTPAVQVDWLTPTTVRTKYYAREESRLINMTCGRVNECHPNATGVHRCLFYFSVEDEEDMQKAELQARHRSPREFSVYKLLNTDTDVVSQTAEYVGPLEDIEDVVLFDKSEEKILNLPIVESEYVGFNLDVHPEGSGDVQEELLEEDVQFETPDSELYVQMEDEDSSMESEDDSSQEDEKRARLEIDSLDLDLFRSKSNLFLGRSWRIQKLLNKLHDLKSKLAEALDSIEED